MKIAIGRILPDGGEVRDGVASFANLATFCVALNKGSAPSAGKQRHGPYWAPFDAPRQKGEKPDWQVLVLDYDAGDPPPNLVQYERVVYQTPSSTPEARRWRVIVALTEPAPFAEIDGLRRMFPGADPKAAVSSQIFWHRHPEHKAEHLPGIALNWRAVAKPAPQPEKAPVSVEPTMSKEALLEALYRLDPDLGYDDWVHIGMALHHEYNGAQAGFDEWLHWSERGAKFAGVNDLTSHWRSFKAGGGFTGQLLLMLQRAHADDFPLVAEAPPNPSRFKSIPAGEFEQPVEHIEYLVAGMIEHGSTCALIGARKSAKSYAALDLAFAVGGAPRHSGTWAERDVQKRGRVVWIAAEGARSLARRRLPQWLRHYGAPDLQIIAQPIRLHDAKAMADLLPACQGATLIVIDSLRAATQGAEENSNDTLPFAVLACENLARKIGATVVLIAHASLKSATKTARGASGIEDQLEAGFFIAKKDGVTAMSTGFARDEATDERLHGIQLEAIHPPGVAPGVVVKWYAIVESRPEPEGHQLTALNYMREVKDAVIDAACDALHKLHGQRRPSDWKRQLKALTDDGWLVEYGDNRIKLKAADFETLTAPNLDELMGV